MRLSRPTLESTAHLTRENGRERVGEVGMEGRTAGRSLLWPKDEFDDLVGHVMNRQPDMRQIMKQAQQMQEQLAAAQEELASQTFEGSAGGGMVTATVTGSQQLSEITIDPSVVDPADVEMLQDLVVAAVNQAMKAAGDAAGEQFGGLGGGLDLGGLLG